MEGTTKQDVINKIWEIAKISPEHGDLLMDIIGEGTYKFIMENQSIDNPEKDLCKGFTIRTSPAIVDFDPNDKEQFSSSKSYLEMVLNDVNEQLNSGKLTVPEAYRLLYGKLGVEDELWGI